MAGQHELAELAPRDIVAKAITRRMRETGTAHMYLDARHFGAADVGQPASRPSWPPAGRTASTR